MSELPDYRRAERTVPCAQCGAERGEPCRTPQGKATLEHSTRARTVAAPHTEAGGLADVLAEQYVAHRLYHSEAGTIAGPDWFAEDFAGRAEPALRAYLTARLADDDVRQAVRAKISDAYYDARNNRQTMETAADNATRAALSAAADLIGGGER